jgi:hypothetical protein
VRSITHGESSHRYFPFHGCPRVESGEREIRNRSDGQFPEREAGQGLSAALGVGPTREEGEKVERPKTKQGINTAYAFPAEEID